MNKFRIIMTASVLAVVLIIASVATVDPSQDRLPVREVSWEEKKDFPKAENWEFFPITRQRVMRELGLTEKQTETIKKKRAEFKEKVRALRAEHKGDILSVLTKAQQDTLKMKLDDIQRRRWMRSQALPREYELNRHRDYRRLQEKQDRPCGQRGSDFLLGNAEKATGSRLSWGQIKNMVE